MWRIILSCVMLASPAGAELNCTFETECFEAEQCQRGAFTLSAIMDGEELALATEIAPLEVIEFRTTDDILSAFARENITAFLFTRSGPDARLTLHLPEPGTATYLGTCEGEL